MRTYRSSVNVDWRDRIVIVKRLVDMLTAPLWCAVNQHRDDHGWCADCGRAL